MKWSLIFADSLGCSVQVFNVEGDPQSRAIELLGTDECLAGHTLIAAVRGAEEIRVKDDARASECELQNISDR